MNKINNTSTQLRMFLRAHVQIANGLSNSGPFAIFQKIPELLFVFVLNLKNNPP